MNTSREPVPTTATHTVLYKQQYEPPANPDNRAAAGGVSQELILSDKTGSVNPPADVLYSGTLWPATPCFAGRTPPSQHSDAASSASSASSASFSTCTGTLPGAGAGSGTAGGASARLAGWLLGGPGLLYSTVAQASPGTELADWVVWASDFAVGVGSVGLVVGVLVGVYEAGKWAERGLKRWLKELKEVNSPIPPGVLNNTPPQFANPLQEVATLRAEVTSLRFHNSLLTQLNREFVRQRDAEEAQPAPKGPL